MYNRTQNDNGTYNTRCLYCFMTIASAVEANRELDVLETLHVCPERALAEMMAHARPQSHSTAALPASAPSRRVA
ncbi:MAG TPA: hypothetical protein VGJ21_22270 [Terracidiphilus sp.]|jgi:hypothetical protein